MPRRDEYGNEIYSQGEYEHYVMMGRDFTGFVEDMGYVLSEVVVTPHSINKSGTHFMWGIHRAEFLFELEESGSSVNVNDTQEDDIPNVYNTGTGELYPYLDKIESTISGGGVALNILGNNTRKTRGKFARSQPNTSIASEFFRKSLLKKLSSPQWIRDCKSHAPLYPGGKSIPYLGKTVTDWGTASGRLTPFVGMGATVVGVGLSVNNIHNSGYNPKVITQEAGGWATAYAGAELGATGGAAIGAWFGGAGAIPGAFFGGLIGGIIGYWAGYNGSGEVYNYIMK